MKPLILINFKTYPQVAGKKALSLAKKIAAVKTKKYIVAVAPPTLALKEIAQKTKLLTFAQYVDADNYGAHTGEIVAAELKRDKIAGAIINHSEHRLSLKEIVKRVESCHQNHLMTVICTSNLKELKQVLKLNPNYIAYEPKKLIGGKISVTSAKPEIILQAAELVKKHSKKTKLLCGAGVHNNIDLQTALLLGAEGVLITHAIVKAKRPEKVLRELIK